MQFKPKIWSKHRPTISDARRHKLRYQMPNWKRALKYFNRQFCGCMLGFILITIKLNDTNVFWRFFSPVELEKKTKLASTNLWETEVPREFTRTYESYLIRCPPFCFKGIFDIYNGYFNCLTYSYTLLIIKTG